MKRNHTQILSIFGASVLLFLFSVLVIRVNAAPSAIAGDIVINEIMQNPQAVTDVNGEWFEIINMTGSPIDIEGWVISDDDIDSHTINSGGVLNVNAGGYFVLCRNGDSGANGGVTCDYTYSGFILANGADEVILSEAGIEIDRVNYDDGANFPDPTGGSMAYNRPASGSGLDSILNDDGGNWADSEDAPQSPAYGSGDYGTPGARNHDWMDGNAGRPTAVSLQSFTADTQPTGLILITFTLLLLAMGGVWMRLRRR